MINNVVLVLGVQQSDSVIHIHVSILFQIIFPFRLLQNIEQHSLCYTVGPYIMVTFIDHLLRTSCFANIIQLNLQDNPTE